MKDFLLNEVMAGSVVCMLMTKLVHKEFIQQILIGISLLLACLASLIESFL